MPHRPLLTVALGALLGSVSLVQGTRHLNPVVDLLAQKKSVFGVYAPRNPRARTGAPATADTVRQKTPAGLR